MHEIPLGSIWERNNWSNAHSTEPTLLCRQSRTLDTKEKMGGKELNKAM